MSIYDLMVPNLTAYRLNPMVVARLLLGNRDRLYEFGGGTSILRERVALLPKPKVQERLLAGIFGLYLKSVCLS